MTDKLIKSEQANLEDIANYEGTEWGNYCQLLIEIGDFGYLMSESFLEAYRAEKERQEAEARKYTLSEYETQRTHNYFEIEDYPE